MPSRRFYITRNDDYEEVLKSVKRSKLSLKKKSPRQNAISLQNVSDESAHQDASDQNVGASDSDTGQLGRIEDVVKKVCSYVIVLTCSQNLILQISEDVVDLKGNTLQVRELIRHIECKVCKDIPTNPPVLSTCCGQLIGCKSCFDRCLLNVGSCPMCRSSDPVCINVNGFEALYAQLRLLGGYQPQNS